MPEPPAADLIRGFVATSPFSRKVGLQVVALDSDRATLRLPFVEENITVAEVVHGGAIATLLDTAATASAFCAPGPFEASGGATVSLSIEYIRAGRGDLTAVGNAVRRAGGLCFCEVTATDADDRVVAKALATYRFQPAAN